MRLIDADALREIIYHKAFEEDSNLIRWDSGCWIRYKMFGQALAEAPTIEAEPVRRGRWEDGYECMIHAGVRKMYMRCSVCGEKTIEPGRYCPHCGAQMEV